MRGFNPGGASWLSTPQYTGLGMIMPGDYKSYVKAYESWVYACVWKIAETISGIEHGLYYKKDGQLVRVDDHPFLDLMKKVNPVMNILDLKSLTSIYLDLTGNAYWYTPLNVLKQPAEIWILESQNVKIVPGKDEVVKGYIYQKGNKKTAFEKEEIVHFRYPNPLDPYYYGMSPIQAAHYAVDSNDYMQKYGTAAFKNMGSISLFIQLIEEAQNWNDDQKKEFKKGWLTSHLGVDNAGKMIIAPAIKDIKDFAMSPKEMDYSKSRADIRDELLAIYGVPKSKFTQDVGPRARVESDDYAFHKETIQPKLKRVDMKVTETMLPRYDDRLELHHEDSTPMDKVFELKKEDSRLKNYVTVVNEVREKDGLKPVDWGDRPLAPFNIMPLGSSPPEAGGDKIIRIRQIFTDEIREKLWNAFLRAHTGIENHWVATLGTMYRKQEKEVLKRLKEFFGKGYVKDIADHILLSVTLEEQQMWTASEKYVKNGIERGVALAEGKIGTTGLPADLFGFPSFSEYLKGKELRIKTVPRTFHEQIRTQLIEGVKAGEGYEELSVRVKHSYSSQTDYGARRIARTETTDAINKAQLIAADTSGKVDVKVWLSAMDEETRDTHAEANMQEVPLTGRFEVGGYGCDYPGDPSLPVEELVNCRCDMGFVKYKEE